ncbi:DUF1810 domain-containing protein [Marinobacterium sediminicola]|uniref:Uncharacterized protein, DUF1810 family n=1 Tax=Marinobacterium sediminicola TaxID=518898 RepID=A0ABY1S230_9GAMM|nr:DUF1810 domain-containing protein [Marinobacterium sediminicola]ULG69483.1 DUF1810 domain-containing protein [Marinobacterium sediminicola]SMR75633.1 Uncharacterized protein, DUF1810 family [Marinobacterium sediminicola]
MGTDPFDLNRFVTAQQGAYPQALAELKAGRKRSHWIWYILPQLAVLGRSSMAQHYGLSGLEEARAYLHHPVLGPRLRKCCEALLEHEGLSAHAILGSPDDLKLRSCATLFARADKPGSQFEQILDKYYGGEPDSLTLSYLQRRQG